MFYQWLENKDPEMFLEMGKRMYQTSKKKDPNAAAVITKEQQLKMRSADGPIKTGFKTGAIPSKKAYNRKQGKSINQ